MSLPRETEPVSTGTEGPDGAQLRALAADVVRAARKARALSYHPQFAPEVMQPAPMRPAFVTPNTKAIPWRSRRALLAAAVALASVAAGVLALALPRTRQEAGMVATAAPPAGPVAGVVVSSRPSAPAAMVRARRSPAAPQAIVTGTLRASPTPPAMVRAGRSPAAPRAAGRLPGAAARPARTEGSGVAATDPLAEPGAAAEPRASAAATPDQRLAMSATDQRRLEDLVRTALDGEQPGPEEPKQQAPPPAALGRDQILAGMQALRPRVRDCYLQHRQRGVAQVRVEVSEAGAVKSAEVEGPLAGSPSAACVEAVLKSARFPQSPGLSFRYPFPLR